MLVSDIDEFTLVLFNKKDYDDEKFEWSDRANEIIDNFVEQSKLNDLFGDLIEVEKGSAGYTNHFTYENALFSGFNIAFHEKRKMMGIIVSFSASAWLIFRKYYFEKYNQVFTVVDFLNLIKNENEWRSRLSRIDFLIDFKDENISVDAIFKSLDSKRAKVIFNTGKENTSKIESISVDGVVQTFYLGARSRNNALRMRLYDKKIEQIKKGRSALRLKEAEQLQNWVRLEVVFRGKYAHDLHSKLLQTSTHAELNNLIVNSILAKYQFIYVKSKKDLKITEMMKNMYAVNNDFRFDVTSHTTVELEKMIEHQKKNSGLMSLLRKLDVLYGIGSSKEFLDYLHQHYMNEYIMTESDEIWLNKYQFIYKDKYIKTSKKAWEED